MLMIGPVAGYETTCITLGADELLATHRAENTHDLSLQIGTIIANQRHEHPYVVLSVLPLAV